MKFPEILRRILFVRKCAGCREILTHETWEHAFCPACTLKWNLAKSESCPDCMQAATECRCMPPELSKLGCLSMRKLFFYSPEKSGEPQNRLLYRLKHEPSVRIERAVAQELWFYLQKELAVMEISPEEAVLCWVPRGRRARVDYGFDQSERMMTELSTVSGIPAVRALARKFGGKEQKSLNRRQRFRNTKGLFVIRKPEQIAGKVVVLFDDVVTTGASMAACVPLLQSAGARAIFLLCLARDKK